MWWTGPGMAARPFIRSCRAPFPATAAVLENVSGRFTPPNPTAKNQPLPFQHFHNQWPGKGDVGSPDLDQFVASQGGSYVAVPLAAGSAGAAARSWCGGCACPLAQGGPSCWTRLDPRSS